MKRAASAAASFLVLAVTACGGSGGNSGATTPGPTTTRATSTAPATTTTVPATTMAATTTTVPAPTTTGPAPTTTAAPDTLPMVSPPTTAAPEQPAGVPVMTAGDYLVPGELAPGLYRVRGYFARKDAGDGIVDNDGVYNGGYTLMVVAPTDAQVELNDTAWPIPGARPVHPVEEQLTEGTYLVGPDVAPGRYQIVPVAGDDTTYFARLNNKGDIIQNDFQKGRSIVTVRPGDWALEFDGVITPLP